MDVSRDEAIATCEQVRAENRRRYLSAGHWQCWGCIRFGGEPDNRCMRNDGGWDGCHMVNQRIVDSQTGIR